MRRWSTVFLFSLLVAAASCDAEPALFGAALQGWLRDRDNWAFTQHVREFEGDGQVKEERFERFDPSRPDSRRWTLLQINGRAPTAAELDAFDERKNRKKRRAVKAPADYIDFGRIAVAGESGDQVCYQVPLREDASWLVPLEKLAIAVTVNKDRRCVEHLSAGLREPFRVAFGLVRVTDVMFDLRFASEDTTAFQPPSGTARMTVFKFGKRAEIAWSDFTRVGR